MGSASRLLCLSPQQCWTVCKNTGTWAVLSKAFHLANMQRQQKVTAVILAADQHQLAARPQLTM